MSCKATNNTCRVVPESPAPSLTPCLVGRPTAEAGTVELCCTGGGALISGWLIEGLTPWPAGGPVWLGNCRDPGVL